MPYRGGPRAEPIVITSVKLYNPLQMAENKWVTIGLFHPLWVEGSNPIHNWWLWSPLLWKKDVWRPCFPLVVRWDLRICRALLLGCPSDLGNARGGVFCYQCFFFFYIFLKGCFRFICFSAKFGKWWKCFFCHWKLLHYFRLLIHIYWAINFITPKPPFPSNQHVVFYLFREGNRL